LHRCNNPWCRQHRRHNFEIANDAVRTRFEKQAFLVYVSLVDVEDRKSRACTSNAVRQRDIGRHGGRWWVTTTKFHQQTKSAQNSFNEWNPEVVQVALFF